MGWTRADRASREHSRRGQSGCGRGPVAGHGAGRGRDRVSDNLLPFPGNEPSDGLCAALEALLFASGGPVSSRNLAEALDVEHADVLGGLAALSRGYEDRGIELLEIAGGWQLRTRPEHAGAILKLMGQRPSRLSRAALEVLSVVAYKQPVTRSEVEQLRGVDSGGVMRTLLGRGLLRVAGRKAEPGRPLMYGTTRAFLEMFALSDLRDLPTLREREELEEDV
ncbi:MAG: SMC-Scp complex subunit ScpB [Proteobacteria bacterium]|nr:SMC-Scp complex subunit ScpB [Pseudomonadota bacterium]